MILNPNTGEEKFYLLVSKTGDDELERLFKQFLNANSIPVRRRISRKIEDVFYSHNLGEKGPFKIPNPDKNKQPIELEGYLIKGTGQDFYYSIGFNHVD